MLLGTSSGVGKSLMTAALCRVLLRKGERPLPFKGQNMSNNAWVDKNGGEMAFSQALQSWAAGADPICSMNPILLKPKGDSTSEVIHMGKSVGIAKAENYYSEWFELGWESIISGLQDLKNREKLARLIIEGAGSPVEVNLKNRDLTNMRIARFVNAKCILVADIEKGGVFAQIIGTLALLEPDERRLIRGILINRFRGNRKLFDDGKSWLENKTGIPVLGIMPWLNDTFPPEDSLDLLERGKPKPNTQIEIAVLKLNYISNFSDLDPLESEPTVNLRWIRKRDEFGNPDALIIPGSKQTINDLEKLKNVGLANQIRDYASQGGNILGICGGMQILGHSLEDPFNLEDKKGNSNNSLITGLNLLPIRTRFENEKKLCRRNIEFTWPIKTNLIGFELHHGVSKLLHEEDENTFSLSNIPGIGWGSKRDGESPTVVGTYLHGILDNGNWRRAWLNQIRIQKGLSPLPLDQPHHLVRINKLLDLLADSFEDHVNYSSILED